MIDDSDTLPTSFSHHLGAGIGEEHLLSGMGKSVMPHVYLLMSARVASGMSDI